MAVPQNTVQVQGQGAVSADYLNSIVQTVTNLAALRGFVGVPNMQIDLQGNVTPGDGGEGSFYWNASAVGPDNGTTIIVPNAAGVGAWVRFSGGGEQTTSVVNIAALRLFTEQSITNAVLVEGYYTPGDGGGGWFEYIPSDTTSADNGGTIIVAVAARWYRVYSGSVNAKWFGVTGKGFTDDTANIMKAVSFVTSTNGSLTFPAGTYFLATTVPAPIPAVDPVVILIEGASNFAINAESGATFVCANAIANSTQFLFYKCNNFTISGLTNQGNRAGLTAGQENAAYTIESCVNFLFERIHISGNWAAEGAGFAGDWMVNGTFRDIIMDGVGIGFDFAFLQNVLFDNCIGTGLGTTYPIGDRFISVIYDVPLASYNETGITFLNNNTNNVTIRDCSASNFSSTILFATGVSLSIIGGHYNNNPGESIVNAAGIGIYISYEVGSFSSAGFPVQGVVISGVDLSNNGNSAQGYGIVIDGTAIVNGDFISDVMITGCNIYNNEIYGIEVNGPTKVKNVSVIGNMFGGTLQTAPIGTNLFTEMVTSSLPNNAKVNDNLGFNPVGFETVALPGATGSTYAVTNTYSSPMQVLIPTQVSAYQPVVQSPAASFNLGTVAANSGPITFTLPPGHNVYFNTAVPTTWRWMAAS